MGVTSPSSPLEVYNTGVADGAYLIKATGSSIPGGFAKAQLGLPNGKTVIRLGNTGSADNSYFWVDDSQVFRYNNGLPGSDNAGAPVGTQTSTRSSKQDMVPFDNVETALNQVLGARLYRFRYINEVRGYRDRAKAHIGFIADEVHPDFMDSFGVTIDQVSVNGLLIGSIQALAKSIAQRDLQIITLSKENQSLRAELAETKKSLVRVSQRIDGQEKQYAERLTRLERTLASSSLARR